MSDLILSDLECSFEGLVIRRLDVAWLGGEEDTVGVVGSCGGIGDVGFEFCKGSAEFAVMDLANGYGGTAGISIDRVVLVWTVILIWLGGSGFRGRNG